jgi:hypothetical protein
MIFVSCPVFIAVSRNIVVEAAGRGVGVITFGRLGVINRGRNTGW